MSGQVEQRRGTKVRKRKEVSTKHNLTIYLLPEIRNNLQLRMAQNLTFVLNVLLLSWNLCIYVVVDTLNR